MGFGLDDVGTVIDNGVALAGEEDHMILGRCVSNMTADGLQRISNLSRARAFVLAISYLLYICSTSSYTTAGTIYLPCVASKANQGLGIVHVYTVYAVYAVIVGINKCMSQLFMTFLF